MTTSTSYQSTTTELAVRAAKYALIDERPIRLAAEEIGVKPDLARAAFRILLWDEDVFEKIEAGALTLHAAYKLLPKRTAAPRRQAPDTTVPVLDGQLDVEAVLQRCLRLPEIRAMLKERGASTAWRPRELIIRRKAANWCSGRATYGAQRILLTIGDRCPRERAEELILHELVHLVVNVNRRGNWEHHGALYRVTLLRAARELWPGLTVRNEGRCYDMDEQIWREARQLGCRTDVHGGLDNVPASC